MIYGNSLLHFSELFVTVEYYKDTANIGAGFTREYLGTTVIIIQQGSGETLVGPSGRLAGRSNWRVADSSDYETIWTMEDSPLELGLTIKHPENNLFYRLVKGTSWEEYAGYKKFGLQKIQGNNNNSSVAPTVKSGVF